MSRCIAIVHALPLDEDWVTYPLFSNSVKLRDLVVASSNPATAFNNHLAGPNFLLRIVGAQIANQTRSAILRRTRVVPFPSVFPATSKRQLSISEVVASFFLLGWPPGLSQVGAHIGWQAVAQFVSATLHDEGPCAAFLSSICRSTCLNTLLRVDPSTSELIHRSFIVVAIWLHVRSSSSCHTNHAQGPFFSQPAHHSPAVFVWH